MSTPVSNLETVALEENDIDNYLICSYGWMEPGIWNLDFIIFLIKGKIVLDKKV